VQGKNGCGSQRGRKQNKQDTSPQFKAVASQVTRGRHGEAVGDVVREYHHMAKLHTPDPVWEHYGQVGIPLGLTRINVMIIAECSAMRKTE
jgi:hypothetical protein